MHLGDERGDVRVVGVPTDTWIGSWYLYPDALGSPCLESNAEPFVYVGGSIEPGRYEGCLRL